jgi:rare lipoprotein A
MKSLLAIASAVLALGAMGTSPAAASSEMMSREFAARLSGEAMRPPPRQRMAKATIRDFDEDYAARDRDEDDEARPQRSRRAHDKVDRPRRAERRHTRRHAPHARRHARTPRHSDRRRAGRRHQHHRRAGDRRHRFAAHHAARHPRRLRTPRWARRSLAETRRGRSHLRGIASYYWQGRRVASGGRFNPNGMTAAHRTLPFGTRVRVTHLGNGRSVNVVINDRGPFIAGRVIDLSRGAAGVLGMLSQGIARVSVTILGR